MISIFAKRAFLNTAPNIAFQSKEVSYHGRGHLQRVSSMIRADQIAEYLGAKLNPEGGFDKDVCIYVKPHVTPGHDFDFAGVRSYVDIIDGWGLIPLLEKHPEVGVIACSKQDYWKLSFLPNKRVFIPQHHCNYNNERRTRKDIQTVGIIGTEDAFEHIPAELEQEIIKRGITLLKYSKFFSRQDVIDFYKQIDIQLVWRPYRMRLSNPLKIVNAASFGIQTIAFDESVFGEVHRCYMPVRNVEEFFIKLDYYMAHPELHERMAKGVIEKAEEYHISKVAEMYKQL